LSTTSTTATKTAASDGLGPHGSAQANGSFPAPVDAGHSRAQSSRAQEIFDKGDGANLNLSTSMGHGKRMGQARQKPARPSICPNDPDDALRRIRQALPLLRAALDPVDLLWLQSAIDLRLSGQAQTLDEALGLRRTTPRRQKALRRHTAVRELARALALGQTWAAAMQVQLVVLGAAEAPAGFEVLVNELRADKATPRSIEGLWRIISSARDADQGAGQGTDATLTFLRQWPALDAMAITTSKE
jgi:hypothetical protein